MEVKKNPKYDLENKRFIFLEIGFLISLALVFMAFEYKLSTVQAQEIAYTELEEIEDLIPITIQENKKTKPLVKPKIVQLSIIDLIEDELEDDDLQIIDAEANEDDETEIKEIEEEIIEDDEEDVIFVTAEFMPIFNPKVNKTYEEGKRDLFRWMNKIVRYPIIAQENGIEGRVFFRFLVDKKGNVSNIEIIRGIDPSLDKEAIRVVSKIKKFKPGYQRQKAVNVWFSGYLNFKLQ